MKKTAIVLILAAAFAVSAHAQKGREPTPKEIEEKRQAARLEQQYKDTLRRTNADKAETTTTTTDPWATMRGTQAPPKR